MKREESTLFHSLVTIIDDLLRGRIHFPKKYVGRVLTMEDGRKYTVFRHLMVDPMKETQTKMAVFKVRFKFANLSPGINKYLSMIPAPFLIARRGFRQKIWTINDNGYFQGIYQWASKEFAKEYPESFIFKVMTKRSATDSLFYEILPDTHLSEYVKKLNTI